jgi:GNAT superfamily N-acetyltransferase
LRDTPAPGRQTLRRRIHQMDFLQALHAPELWQRSAVLVRPRIVCSRSRTLFHMVIRRAEQPDLRNLCITAMRAFADDPVMRWLYPDDEDYFLPNGAVFESSMTNWLANQQPWCTDDAAALAIWFPPVEPGAPEPEWIAIGPPPSEDLLARFALIGLVMAEHKPAEPYWYLQLLATHPDWQRHGLGAQLMQVVFEQADEQGIPCYLETERPELVAYYRTFGFEVRSEWVLDPEATLGAVGPKMWGMYRPTR